MKSRKNHDLKYRLEIAPLLLSKILLFSGSLNAVLKVTKISTMNVKSMKQSKTHMKADVVLKNTTFNGMYMVLSSNINMMNKSQICFLNESGNTIYQPIFASAIFRLICSILSKSRSSTLSSLLLIISFFYIYLMKLVLVSLLKPAE